MKKWRAFGRPWLYRGKHQDYATCYEDVEATRSSFAASASYSDWTTTHLTMHPSLWAEISVTMRNSLLLEELQESFPNWVSSMLLRSCSQADLKLFSDDLPGWTLQAMKCLANWPWKNSELNWPCYPGFERDVFATVLDFFATQPTPLIPYEQQELLLEVLSKSPVNDSWVRDITCLFRPGRVFGRSAMGRQSRRTDANSARSIPHHRF